MNECKRLSDCPADRLAQCRGQAVQARCDALQGLLNKADQQISDLTHFSPVPPAGDVEVLAVVTLGSFSAEELGDIDIEPRMVALESLQQKVVKNQDVYIELVDRAHVTRLTAERNGLLAKLVVSRTQLSVSMQRSEQLQSELTKAREFIGLLRDIAFNDEAVIYSYAPGYIVDIRDAFRALHPATPIAHNVDESCGQDAEAAKEENWHMNPCKQGHGDVGACGGEAFCHTCDETITAANTQDAFEQWNATHPAAAQ